MIELLETSNKDNIYSALIKLSIASEELRLRFGIERADYGRLKQILEFRPFENTGVARYRYFFALSYRKDTENQELVHTAIRVEQLDRHKQYEFVVSKKFVSNILWFNSLTDKKDIEPMIER
ncbi:hypothetical protein [Algoriphagus antarcticus]|nr:hypothetical protein [Algoriphagus antarcticus]